MLQTLKSETSYVHIFHFICRPPALHSFTEHWDTYSGSVLPLALLRVAITSGSQRLPAAPSGSQRLPAAPIVCSRPACWEVLRTAMTLTCSAFDLFFKFLKPQNRKHEYLLLMWSFDWNERGGGGRKIIISLLIRKCVIRTDNLVAFTAGVLTILQ
jgi:hypothetical protein